jgi:hypothetical protein
MRNVYRTTKSSIPTPATGKSTVWHDYAGRARYESSPRMEPVQERPSRFAAFARALVGALSAGLLVVAFALLAVQIWAGNNNLGGPGVPDVVTHFAVALLALVLCAAADRRRGFVGGLCCLLAFACVAATLWFWWWM